MMLREGNLRHSHTLKIIIERKKEMREKRTEENINKWVNNNE